MKKLLALSSPILLAVLGYAQTTPVVVPDTAQCATSTDGSVVGVPNPLQVPQTAAVYSGGSLGPGNFYVEIAWYDAAAHKTLVSPETVRQLTATGQLQVSPPVSGNPSNATGFSVYIGTASGTETLQGSLAGFGTYAQTVALVSGSAIPSSNATVCQIIANDAGWPSGTGYGVSLVSPSGSTLPGYPMQWQLLGPGTTINLGQGLPLYNGTVTYPIPILARPYNHAIQSISGPLSMSGYALSQILKIGVGTSVPAWGVDVEGSGLNAYINAKGGYLLNGSGGNTGQALCSDGTYLDQFCTFLTSLPTLYYQTVQANTVDQTQRAKLNFSTRFTLSDSASPSRTTVDLATQGSVTPGAYTCANPTVNAYGIVTAISSNTCAPAFTGSSGYQILPSGLIFQWGVTGSVTNDTPATISFPETFPNGCLNITATDMFLGSASATWSAYNCTTTGFTARPDGNTAGAHYLAIGW